MYRTNWTETFRLFILYIIFITESSSNAGNLMDLVGNLPEEIYFLISACGIIMSAYFYG